MTRQVFVNDRQNHRVQVFDENGKYLREWSFGAAAVGHPPVHHHARIGICGPPIAARRRC